MYEAETKQRADTTRTTAMPAIAPALRWGLDADEPSEVCIGELEDSTDEVVSNRLEVAVD